MKQLQRAKISALGTYVPPRLLTNADLEKMVETNDQWIQERTGIRQRHLVDKGVATSDISCEAARKALAQGGVPASQIEAIIVGTVTPDMVFPATACLIQSKLGAPGAWGFDLSAACSGFVYALQCGAQLIQTGSHKKVLVIGADVMSSIIDYTDRATCVLFGDAAGAVLLEPDTNGFGIMDSLVRSDGSGMIHLHQKAGGSRMPPTAETVAKRLHYVHQEGAAVYKFAIAKMAEVAGEIMSRNNLRAEMIDWLVPHQANKRIIESTAERMGVPMDKVMVTIQKYGNTTNATIPLCLWDYEPKLKRGDRMVLAAFGGGFTWAGAYVQWAYDGAGAPKLNGKSNGKAS